MKALLDKVTCPQELKNLSPAELPLLAQEVRARIINVLSETGGHLSSNLGIVELTIALHYTFHSPKDKFIFDVGHQSYVHKILTGRNSHFSTLRQTEGLSGFLAPSESPHDHFYTGHAGNALSLALGVAKSRDLMGESSSIIPILGDAALTCGLTLEAMNNIPRKLGKFLVILNDNAMSISKNVGAITNILSRFLNSPTANHIYDEIAQIISKIPGYRELLAKQGHQVKESLKTLISTAPFFEQFGLSYVGPIDGHDIQKLLSTFAALKEVEHPVLVHILTVKGQGMKNAIDDPTPYHGAKPFDRVTGEFHPSRGKRASFPKVFGKHLLKMAEKDPTIVAITPAMPVGSCLDLFMRKIPERCIDVGIAEGHSLTFAGGLGHGGKLKVVVSVYSSFLQRAFDNIYHDICVQNAPVVIAIDRAGLALGDGVTAQGIYDIAYLNALPGIVITQPRNGKVLKELMESAFDWRKPVAIRYPNLTTEEEDSSLQKRPFAQGEVLAEGSDVIIVSLGHLDQIALEARTLLQSKGIQAAVIDPIFLKPLDKELLRRYFSKGKLVITVEEHALQGGLGSIINSFILGEKFSHLSVKNLGLPDSLIHHGDHATLCAKYGLTAARIAQQALEELTPHFTSV